jgi:hypothetical protein
VVGLDVRELRPVGDGSPYVEVGLAYVFLTIGVGLFGTPPSRSLTSSVPVKRVGMAPGTADLQRDLGRRSCSPFSVRC